MSGAIQRLALSEAPGTTRPGEDAGRVEPRVDDPALPAPSGGATREGGVGGLRETAASTAPGNTRPDEDVGRVGPRQLDAATSQAPMEEEPDWSCDNQSEDGCLLSHAPTEAMQITEGSSPTKGGEAPEARKEPEEWAQCNKGDEWPRSGEDQDWANDVESVDDSVHPSIATALESVTTGTSIKGLLLGGRTKQPRTQVESQEEHSADVVRPTNADYRNPDLTDGTTMYEDWQCSAHSAQTPQMLITYENMIAVPLGKRMAVTSATPPSGH